MPASRHIVATSWRRKSRENGSAQTGARTREQLQESEEAVSVRGIGWHLFSVLSVNGTVQTK